MHQSRRALGLGLAAALAACTVAISAQERPVDRAFQHYERIRVALAQDTTKDVAAEAGALAPLAAELAGEEAGAAAQSLATAKDLNQSRDHFAKLSDALVPKFMEAGIPGVQGFMCAMNKRRWAQRGTAVENPYYGKAMLNCGAPIKGTGGR